MIIFEDFVNLSGCLEAMSSDINVEVVRIKNRYSHEYSAIESAGYRWFCSLRNFAFEASSWLVTHLYLARSISARYCT